MFYSCNQRRKHTFDKIILWQIDTLGLYFDPTTIEMFNNLLVIDFTIS